MGSCAKSVCCSVVITKLGIAKIEEEWQALTATNGLDLGDVAAKSPSASARPPLMEALTFLVFPLLQHLPDWVTGQANMREEER